MTNIEHRPTTKSRRKVKDEVHEYDQGSAAENQLTAIDRYAASIHDLIDESQRIPVDELIATAPEFEGYDKVELILALLDQLESDRLISLFVDVDRSTSSRKVIAASVT